MQLDTPNVVLPLAISYNERGVDGVTNTITNSLDQRKINSIYLVVKNALTGKTTLYLAKRPGLSIIAQTYGTTGQVAHLYEIAAGNANEYWVLSTSGNDIRASDSSSTTVIVTASGYKPAYVDKTSISGTDTMVVQLRNASFAQRVFYASAVGAWTEIVDADFTALTVLGKMEHLDGYAFILDSRNRIYNSDVNSLSSWPTLGYITKSIDQDTPRGLARLGDQIIAFGSYTMEIFRNGGGTPAGSPLVTVPQMSQRTGMMITNTVDFRHYYTQIGKRIFWRGTHPNAVYSYDGQRVEKVSTPAIDKILTPALIYSVCFIGWPGYEAVAISFNTSADTTQRWLMFFPSLNDWFEWTSTVVAPTAPIRSSATMLGLGANQHKLYQINATDMWQDNGTNYDRVHQFQLPTNGNARSFMRWCGLQGTLERSASTESVQFSDDDGVTWSTARTIDRTAQKQHIYRCGSFNQRLVRLTNSANFEGRIEKFLARID